MWLISHSFEIRNMSVSEILYMRDGYLFHFLISLIIKEPQLNYFLSDTFIHFLHFFFLMRSSLQYITTDKVIILHNLICIYL